MLGSMERALEYGETKKLQMVSLRLPWSFLSERKTPGIFTKYTPRLRRVLLRYLQTVLTCSSEACIEDESEERVSGLALCMGLAERFVDPIHLPLFPRHSEGFIPPTPQELLQNLLPSDRTKPSQSKRWMNTTANTATTTATKPHIPSPSIASGKGGVALEKRSHHRKIGRDTSPPVSATSAESRRRGVRGTPVDVPPPDITMSPVSGGNTRRKMPLPSQRRESSSPSATPPAGNAPLARKRNTMNSRDSAYDDAIAASLREIAAKEALAHGHVFEEDDDAEGKGMKRRRAEEEEVEEHEEVIAKRAKKKKDEEAGSERECELRTRPPFTPSHPPLTLSLLSQSTTADPGHPKPSTPINTPTDLKSQANPITLPCRRSRPNTHP